MNEIKHYFKTMLSFVLLISFQLMGCTNEDVVSIAPSFEIEELDNNTVHLINTTVGNYDFIEWDLDDGSIVEKSESFYHTFVSKGTYTITLTVWKEAEPYLSSKQITIENDCINLEFDVTEDQDKTNTFELTTELAPGQGKWVLDETMYLKGENTLYIPFKGEYNLTQEVEINGNSYKSSKQITVKEDDPNFSDKMQLVWSDEFDTNTLNTEYWKFETGAHGWGNNEWQNYVANDNIELKEGKLHIVAEKIGEGQKVGDYTSTRLNSTKSFTYGRFEFRAKMPESKGNGVWPALWMLGEDIGTVGWPNCGEIDMMEYISFDPNNVFFTIHSLANNHSIGTQIGSGAISLPTAEEEFHNYGIVWTERFIRFYIDKMDNIKLEVTRPTVYNEDNWPFAKPFYFLMNIAVGGDWGGSKGVDDSIFPSTMEVDYLKVWQF